MQQFVAFHDGSDQGWQAVYLAFHVAARLGASLRVLLASTDAAGETAAQRAVQVEIGGRAAGVALDTRIVPQVSFHSLTTGIPALNAIFLPYRLLPADEAALPALQNISCPVWIVQTEPQAPAVAVLLADLHRDESLISYAVLMAQRMGQTLTGLVVGGESSQATHPAAGLAWKSMENLSRPAIASALDQLHADLLFMHPSGFPLVRGLSCTCVVYPAAGDA